MKTSIHHLFALMAIFLTLINPISAQEITTRNGLLKGVFEDDIAVFKGIPFAIPPVGALRWRAPMPPKAWTGVRKADTFSPICMQVGMYPKNLAQEEMSEDCLYLNVWKPKETKQAKLPVMLWLYGGGLINGSASTSIYAGDQLAKHDVILITANYRLGAFGFLAHPELSEEADYKSSGNYGLLDMIAALRWIQENIESFGGDPNNVTVFGQSSGAISISALMASPLADGLFHKAIAQSGGLFEPIELDDGFSLSVLEQAGLRFASRAGANSLQDLRKIPAEELVRVPVHTSINIDGYVLKQSPFKAYKNKEHISVPVLLGNTSAEGYEFISDLSISQESYRRELNKHFPSWLVWLAAPAPGKTDEEAIKAAISFEGDIRFKWNMWTWAKLASRDKDQKVFVYQFDKSPPFPSDPVEVGAPHGSDLYYVFGQFDHPKGEWTKKDFELSSLMIKYWTNFAKYGDPNAGGLPQWPEFSVDKPTALHLGEEVQASSMVTEGTLLKIDRLYNLARWTLQHFMKVIIISLALFLMLGLLLFKKIRNREKKP